MHRVSLLVLIAKGRLRLCTERNVSQVIQFEHSTEIHIVIESLAVKKYRTSFMGSPPTCTAVSNLLFNVRNLQESFRVSIAPENHFSLALSWITNGWLCVYDRLHFLSCNLSHSVTSVPRAHTHRTHGWDYENNDD